MFWPTVRRYENATISTETRSSFQRNPIYVLFCYCIIPAVFGLCCSMDRCQNEHLLERALLCCFNLAFMVELLQRRSLSPKFLARLNRETLEEIRTLESILERLETS